MAKYGIETENYGAQNLFSNKCKIIIQLVNFKVKIKTQVPENYLEGYAKDILTKQVLFNFPAWQFLKFR